MGWESYVVVHNIAKRHNVGTLARSATAFGVSELILVGRRDFNCFGSHGSSSHLRFRHFHSLQDARNFLKDKDFHICGVEITHHSLPINHHPFSKSTAFLLGNEGTGLSPKEIQICDFFVYIPHYGPGTASLNVTVAASIVLHHFGVWAGFTERARDGNKFVVAERPEKHGRRNYSTEAEDSIIEERKARRENAANGFFDEVDSGNSSSNLLDTLFVDGWGLGKAAYDMAGFIYVTFQKDPLDGGRLLPILAVHIGTYGVSMLQPPPETGHQVFNTNIVLVADAFL
ncbi:hypothetical protein VNO78_22631 [Psophocarpus tetragonolobus]|uniref:tRNA/rRNA methyltransferase SpoU type domain-containing protein n=1 Tax=Psophocarpus tetragonolobus TaxID=3891 RepID=A0AAN9S3C1_PSOTE